jgi:hypothetical protein
MVEGTDLVALPEKPVKIVRVEFLLRAYPNSIPKLLIWVLSVYLPKIPSFFINKDVRTISRS